MDLAHQKMEEKYLIRYKTDRTTRPYDLPEELRTELLGIRGVVIEYEFFVLPTIIATIPKDELDRVRSLDSIVMVYVPTWATYFKGDKP